MHDDGIKKKKKDDMDKLRMILDNPTKSKAISQDDPLLNSVRKRIGGDYPEKRMVKVASTQSIPSSDSFQPHVTVYEPQKRLPPLRKEPIVHHEESREKHILSEQKVKRKRQDISFIIPVEDLYEIERVSPQEKITPWSSKEEQLPEWIPVDSDVQPVESTTKTSSKEKTLPEWAPIDEFEPPQTREESPEEKKPLPEWDIVDETKQPDQWRESTQPEKKSQPEVEPITEEEHIVQPEQHQSITEPQPVPVEKPEPFIPRIEKDGKRDVFHEVSSIDPAAAEILYEKGFTSVDHIRVSTIKSLIQAGIEKHIAKTIKRDIVRLDKKTAKDAKKAAHITISVKTMPVDQPKTKEIIPPPDKTKTVEEQPHTEELPLWESVQVPPPEEKPPIIPPQQPPEIIPEEKPRKKRVKKPKKPRDIEMKPLQDVSEEWIPKSEPISEPKPPAEEPIHNEWEPTTIAPQPQSLDQSTQQPYRFGEYSLYKKEIVTMDGKLRTIHFFSKEKPEVGELAQLPEGFEVDVSKKTGLPYLRKKTS